MVFAFLTNEAIQDTVENVVPTVLNTLDNVGAFTTATLNVRQRTCPMWSYKLADIHIVMHGNSSSKGMDLLSTHVYCMY